MANRANQIEIRLVATAILDTDRAPDVIGPAARARIAPLWADFKAAIAAEIASDALTDLEGYTVTIAGFDPLDT